MKKQTGMSRHEKRARPARFLKERTRVMLDLDADIVRDIEHPVKDITANAAVKIVPSVTRRRPRRVSKTRFLTTPLHARFISVLLNRAAPRRIAKRSFVVLKS